MNIKLSKSAELKSTLYLRNNSTLVDLDKDENKNSIRVGCQLTTMIVIWLTTTSLFTLWRMEFTSYTLFLIAIMVLLGVITIGAGAAVFCCFG